MLRPSKNEIHGIKKPPTTPRPPAPPSQNVQVKQEMISKISMWKNELERQGASLGVISVFDSICVYLGDQQREIDRLTEEVEGWRNEFAGI